MNKKSRWIATGIVLILSFALIFSSQVFADEVTIIGKVNDNYQIVTEDSTVYEVAETEMGMDLLEHVDKTVKVTGTVVEEEGVNIITVTFFEVIEST